MKIPIVIHPTFWITAALIGFFNGRTVLGTLMWMGIIFISILFHELGHALAARAFGKRPRIELVALGGLTYHDGENLARWKQFLIVFNGPLFGFLLFVLGSLILPFAQNSVWQIPLKALVSINLFWTVLNLLPVFPLDGGQLLRILCESIFGVRGVKFALVISIAVGVVLSLLFFLIQEFLAGALFFLLAFQSYDAWRQTRTLSSSDQRQAVKQLFEEAEIALMAGRKEEALALFDKVRKEANEGVLHTLAAERIAFLVCEKGDTKTCYDMLRPLEKTLSPEALALLQRVAFNEKDYALVVRLAGPCFQLWPGVETALRNATACSQLAQTDAAIGWLQTALSEGLENIQEVLSDPRFDVIRGDPAFRHFSKGL